MKKNIAILGSTGSIGVSLLNIVSKNKKNFDIKLLSAHKNYRKLFKQAELYNVKNIIITDPKSYKIAKSKKKNLKIHNNFQNLSKIFKKKIDYVMCSIIGIEGLYPITQIIKHTKRIAIANKEPIICAWNIIKKELKKYKTEFIPVDSEHFSIWYALNSKSINQVKKIYITASGGPLLNVSKKNYNKLSLSQILNHPNWKMGKKITVDSSTMMNKVFEIIEAKNIFDLQYQKLSIIIHPKSYLHAIILFNDGMIKIIAHDTTMSIPIHNTLYVNEQKNLKIKNLDLKKLNNLKLKPIENKKFPVVNILKNLPLKNSLYETALVSANDELVNLYLKKLINYTDITKILLSFLNKNDIKKLKKNFPKNLSQIMKVNKDVRLQLNSLYI